MNRFKLDPEALGGGATIAPTAASPNGLARAASAAGIATVSDAERRIAEQQDAIFRSAGVARLERQWQELAEAQWESFDPEEEDVGDSYAGIVAREIDRTMEEQARRAPSAAAGEGLLLDADEVAAAGKRQALLRERGARLAGARRSVKARLDELQAMVEREPELLAEALTRADRLIGDNRALLAGRDLAKVRLGAHETLARRAIAGALARDPQGAAGKLPGRAVLAKAELEAWDAVARSVAEVRAEQDARETRRRFAADARSMRESGEPLIELPDWILDFSGGAAGRAGPRLREAEALAERQVKARDAALQAHRDFQAGKFDDYAADLAALDSDDGDSDDEDDFSDDATSADESWWRGAQDGAAHLKRLRRQHARRLLADPAAVAFEHAPIARAFEGGDIESAVAQSMALQKRMGVKAARPLPRAHAEALVARLTQMPAEELPAALAGLRRAGEKNFPALLAQLARVGLPPSLALAAALEGQAQRLLLQAHEAAGGTASAGAALAGGGAAPMRPDPDTIEQAKAGLAETALGRLLHAGAERHGRNEPAWELAYRAAEAAVAQLGAHLARSEGEAGAQRAGRLLFGALEDDRKALDGVASALGAPTEGRAALHRVAGGGAVPVAPEAAADAAADFAGTDSAITDSAATGEAETPAAPAPGVDPSLVQNSVGGDGEQDGAVDEHDGVDDDDIDPDSFDDESADGIDELPFDPEFERDMEARGYDPDKARLLHQIATTTPEQVEYLKQRIDEVFGADFMWRGSLANFAEQLAQMAPDDPRRKVVLEAFASDMRRPIDLPDWLKPFGPVLEAASVFLGGGRAKGAKGPPRKKPKRIANPPRRYDDPHSPDDPRFKAWLEKTTATHSSKHHGNTPTGIGKGTKDPNAVFATSIRIGPHTRRRVGINRETGEFVVFDFTESGSFHHHVRTWDDLPPLAKKALREYGLTTRSGKIIHSTRGLQR